MATEEDTILGLPSSLSSPLIPCVRWLNTDSWEDSSELLSLLPQRTGRVRDELDFLVAAATRESKDGEPGIKEISPPGELNREDREAKVGVNVGVSKVLFFGRGVRNPFKGADDAGTCERGKGEAGPLRGSTEIC